MSNTVRAQTIAAGVYHSVSLCSDGTVTCWGVNDFGELGNGSNTKSKVPVYVNSLTGIVAITAGTRHSLSLKNDGTVWAWGKNTDGQLGNGSNTNSNIPVQVTGLTDITAIAAGYYHSLALKNNGTVWAWGANGDGALGNGTTVTSKNVPTQMAGLTGIIAIAGGSGFSLAIKNDGTVWACGTNSGYQLGNGTNSASFVPVQVSSLTGITAISAGDYYSLAIKNDGTVWAWGENYYGVYGNGTTTDGTTPVQVLSSLTGFTKIKAAKSYSIAIKNDGTMWAWGYNTNGQLGNGSTTNSNIPVQVTGLTNISEIAGGFYHSLALKNDGSGWAWGDNTFGQLGNGTQTNSHIPVQVMGLCNGASAILENAEENYISVYPNPSIGIFQLTVDNMQLAKGELEIYNVFGKKVYTASNIKQQMQIDLSTLSKGIYFIKVYDGTKIYNQKIVVQ